MKKYNFNAGPSILPREVIENTAKQCLDFPWWWCLSGVLHDPLQLPD